MFIGWKMSQIYRFLFTQKVLIFLACVHSAALKLVEEDASFVLLVS